MKRLVLIVIVLMCALPQHGMAAPATGDSTTVLASNWDWLEFDGPTTKSGFRIEVGLPPDAAGEWSVAFLNDTRKNLQYLSVQPYEKLPDGSREAFGLETDIFPNVIHPGEVGFATFANVKIVNTTFLYLAPKEGLDAKFEFKVIAHDTPVLGVDLRLTSLQMGATGRVDGEVGNYSGHDVREIQIYYWCIEDSGYLTNSGRVDVERSALKSGSTFEFQERSKFDTCSQGSGVFATSVAEPFGS